MLSFGIATKFFKRFCVVIVEKREIVFFYCHTSQGPQKNQPLLMFGNRFSRLAGSKSSRNVWSAGEGVGKEWVVYEETIHGMAPRRCLTQQRRRRVLPREGMWCRAKWGYQPWWAWCVRLIKLTCWTNECVKTHLSIFISSSILSASLCLSFAMKSILARYLWLCPCAHFVLRIAQSSLGKPEFIFEFGKLFSRKRGGGAPPPSHVLTFVSSLLLREFLSLLLSHISSTFTHVPLSLYLFFVFYWFALFLTLSSPPLFSSISEAITMACESAGVRPPRKRKVARIAKECLAGEKAIFWFNICWKWVGKKE